MSTHSGSGSVSANERNDMHDNNSLMRQVYLVHSNETEDTTTDPMYYSPLYQLIGTLLVASIFIVGCVGNLMVVVVVWRCRNMCTPTNCYLVSLAVADVILLMFATLPTLVEIYLVIDEYVFGPVGCSVMVFAQYLCVNVSSLSITALTVERYIAICHPLKVLLR